MATSIATVTTDTTNYIRIHLIVIKGGTLLTKELFLKCVKDSQPGHELSVDGFLAKYRNQILSTSTGQKYEEKLYPLIGTANVDEWDIQLYWYILKVVCNLPNKLDMKKLKNIRNKLAHSPEPSLTDADFKKTLNKIKLIFERSLKFIGCPSLTQEMNNLLQKCENGPLELDEGLKVYHESSRKDIELLKKNQMKMLRNQEIQQTQLTAALKMLTSIENKLPLQSSSGVDIPDVHVIIEVKNCTKDKEQELLEFLIKQFNETIEKPECNFRERFSNSAMHIISQAIIETFQNFLRKGRHVLKVEKGCISITIKCKSISSFVGLVDAYLHGSLLDELKSLRDAVRSWDGCSDVYFDLTISLDEITSAIFEIAKRLDEIVPGEDHENGTHSSEELSKTFFDESTLREDNSTSLPRLTIVIKPETFNQKKTIEELFKEGIVTNEIKQIQHEIRKDSNFTNVEIEANLSESNSPKTVDDSTPGQHRSSSCVTGESLKHKSRLKPETALKETDTEEIKEVQYEPRKDPHSTNVESQAKLPSDSPRKAKHLIAENVSWKDQEDGTHLTKELSKSAVDDSTPGQHRSSSCSSVESLQDKSKLKPETALKETDTEERKEVQYEPRKYPHFTNVESKAKLSVYDSPRKDLNEDVSELFSHIEPNIIFGKSSKGNKSFGSRKNFKLLFSARTPDELKEFHEKCDGKGPTLTVLHGKDSDFFGGYTSQNWSTGKKHHKNDEHAFLFFNKQEECMFFNINEKDKDKAITCGSELGPTFGCKGKKTKGSYLKTFSFGKHTNSQMNKKNMCMQLNGKMNFRKENQFGRQLTKYDINDSEMKVKIIEVYQVTDDILDEAWRFKPTDSDVLRMRDELLKCEPSADFGIHRYNILLTGVTGAGKSSFYNTLASVFAEECRTPAPVGDSTRTTCSVTKTVQAYKLNAIHSRRSCVNIIDIRGFDTERTYARELEHLLNGKLPDAYVFPETAGPVSDDQLLKSPTLADEVHLVCFVVDFEKFQVQQRNEKRVYSSDNTLRTILQIIRRKGLPIAAVVTKFDLVFPQIKGDADHVYDSSEAHAAVRLVAQAFGLQEENVFPIVNYINERQLSPAKNRLAIQALHSMVHLAEKYLKESSLQAPRKQETLKSLFQESQNKTLKVLFVGAVNSGKSSFIDSLMSLTTGKICSNAAGCITRDDSNGDSSTEKFQLHRMKYQNDVGRGTETKTNVYLGDMPGFQTYEGVKLEHVKMVINGNVRNRCMIKYGCDQSSEWYIHEPYGKDRFNCVCIVIDIMSIESMPSTMRTTLTDLICWLKKKEIPFVVILTKIDQLVPKKTLSKTTQSGDLLPTTPKPNSIRDNIDAIAKQLDIKENMIFPVQNYVNESNVRTEMDLRLLNAFRKIVGIGREKNVDDTNAPTERYDSDD